MTVLLTKVLWYRVKDRDEALSSANSYQDPKVLSDIVDMTANFGIDVKNNTLSLTLKNDKGQFIEDGEIMFSEQDQIKVYAKYTDDGADVEDSAWSLDNVTSPDSANLIRVYYVIEYAEKQDDNKKTIEIKCADKTYVMFSRLVTVSAKDGDNKTAPDIIKEAIERATQDQKGLKTHSGSNVTFAVGADFVSDGGYITDERKATKEDGSANGDITFPYKSYSAVWKPLYEVISALSQPEYTNTTTELSSGNVLVNGRPFIFWVDENNDFHWVYPSQTEDTTIVVGTDKVLRENMSKKVFDTVNMVIFSAGDDLNGVGIWDYFYDDTTDSRSLKMKFASYSEISKDMLEEDYKVHTAREAGAKYQYPTDASYPLSASGTWADGATDDDDYNDLLRITAKRRGKTRAMSDIKRTNKSKTRWTGTVELRGYNYSAGDLVKYTSAEQGLSNQLLRIRDVHHIWQKKGWYTTLTLEQDPEKMIISV